MLPTRLIRNELYIKPEWLTDEKIRLMNPELASLEPYIEKLGPSGTALRERITAVSSSPSARIP